MEFCKLLWLRFIIGLKNLVQFWQVVRLYYPTKEFRKVDLYLLRSYLLENPYRISRIYQSKAGEGNLYVYGETPLTTMEKMVKAFKIQPEDTFFELGAGRGRVSFWLHFFVGCKVYAVEKVDLFIRKALHIKKHFSLKNIHFLHQDILDTDFTSADVIYFYGTSAEEEWLSQLLEKFKNLRPGTKIITISFSLSQLSNSQGFKTVMKLPVEFLWGSTLAYLQVKQ